MTSRRFLANPSSPAVAFAVAGVLIVAASAEWLDFRGLRAPILVAVGLCVLGTAYLLALDRGPVEGGASDERLHLGPPLRGTSARIGSGRGTGKAREARLRVRGHSAQLVEFARTVLVGAGIWGAGGALYAIIHAARGEAFEAERFGPQWAQALGLIGVHALFLGVPTGIAAAVVLYGVRRWRPVRERAAPASESA